MDRYLRVVVVPCLLAFCIFVNTAHAVVKNIPSKAQFLSAKGEFIVKFSPNLTQSAEDLIQKKRSFKSAMTNGDDTLDRLNKKVGVRAARHLLNGMAKGKTPQQMKTLLTDHWKDVKAKFAKRAKRAPKGATAPDMSNVYVMTVPDTADVESICKMYQANPNVEYCQPNYQAEAFFVPNDQYYSSSNSWGQAYDDLWGLKKMNMQAAWDVTRGAGMLVAVVDTGLDITHPDIAGNIWTNSGEIPSNGIDDDHNGFIDDIHGWNFTNQTNNVTDGNGHGTHVSGTIAATANNGVGISGVAPEAKIMPVKGLGDNGGGTFAGLAQAILYAATNGADVINASWGCTGACPSNPLIEDAVRTAYSLGVVSVFAAGNSASDTSSVSPQNMIDSKPIVVGASDPDDKPAYFSSYGQELDVVAPGAGLNNVINNELRGILSLKSNNCAPSTCPPSLIVGNKYLRQAGTSMAAPHVAGLAALVMAMHPAFSPEDVRQAIRNSADDINLPGPDFLTGAGRVNAAAALNLGPVPDAKISAPLPTLPITPTAEIVVKGNALGANFDHYQLYYAKDVGNVLGPWIAVGDPVYHSVQDNELGRLQAQPIGIYYLRLSIYTTDGKIKQAATSFIVEPPLTKLASDVFAYGVFSGAQPKAISGDHIVYVKRTNATSPSIYLYDLSAHTDTPISVNNRDKGYPDISNEKVIWLEFDPTGAVGNIYLYDLKTSSTRQLTNVASSKAFPKISGDTVVWVDNRDGNYNIYSYNLTTSVETKLTNSPLLKENPVVEGNIIAWMEITNADGYHVDIMMLDRSTGIQKKISQVPLPIKQTMSINQNRILWSGYFPNGNTFDTRVFLYDIVQGSAREVLNYPSYDSSQEIWGDRIVYQGPPQAQMKKHIFVYDLATSTQRQITSYPALQKEPAIWGGRLVWADFRKGTELYYYDELGTVTLNAPSASVNAGGSVNVQWSATGLPLNNDWIGLFKQGAADNDPSARIYLNCTNTAGGIPPSVGQCVFSIPAQTVPGNYEFRYMVNDSSIAVAKSAAFSILPLVVIDTTAPSVPMNLLANAISTSQITLTWNASTDNVEVVGYAIFRDGVQIATSAGNGYSDVALLPSKTYTYTVAAYDLAGNMSANSTQATAKTLPPDDFSPPTVPQNVRAQFIDSQTIVLNWDPSTDNVAVFTYFLYRDGVQFDGSITNSYVDHHFFQGPVVSYEIVAVDAAGNRSAKSAIVYVAIPEPFVGFVTLTGPSGPVTVGSSVAVQWSATGQPYKEDWIGLYKQGSADADFLAWTYLNCTYQAANNPPASGQCSMAIPNNLEPGTYEFRYLIDNRTSSIAHSGTFDVAAKPALGTVGITGPTGPVTVGSSVAVQWNATGQPHNDDWIGLYKQGTSDSDFLVWTYLSCTYTPVAGDPSNNGQCSMTIPSQLAPGTYEFRYLIDNRSVSVATSASFVVSAKAALGTVTLTGPSGSVVAGSSVAVHWNATGQPHNDDWLGLYKQGTADQDFLAWTYLNCTYSPVAGDPSSDGQCSMTVPSQLSPGIYEFRYLIDNRSVSVAHSSTFDVSVAPH